jgi:glycosyltransferase involved in cell wall biosynthesis
MSPARPLRVALVLPYYDPAHSADPEQALVEQPTLGAIAEAEAARGLSVAAFQLFPTAARLQRGGAEYRFVASPAGVRRMAHWVHRAFPRYQSPYYEPAVELLRQVGPWQPDVLHLFGATLDLNLFLAAEMARRRNMPLVVHYHGGLPNADPVTLAVRRHNLGRAARVLFTSREQARPWLQAGVLARTGQVAEVMETSTLLRPRPQAQARSLTGIRGDPACLMVGRLQAIKDPLTVLTGFALIAERRPLARLHIISQDDTLRPQLAAIVAATPVLAGRVSFYGQVDHAAMPLVYSSADFLLQASRREWSGLAVLEAMACGAIPILSDIPAFRKMTDNGRFGRLFGVGDAVGLARAVLGIPASERPALARSVRRHFEDSLSFQALAGDLESVYHAVRAEQGVLRH